MCAVQQPGCTAGTLLVAFCSHIKRIARAVPACSCTFLDGHVLLDGNHAEESAGGPDLTVGLLPHSRKVSYLEVR